MKEEVVREELTQVRHRNSGNTNTRETQKRPSLGDEEEDPQIDLPSTKRLSHTSSSLPQENASSTNFPNALDRPVPDPSMVLATQTLLSQFNQDTTTSYTPAFPDHQDHAQRKTPVECSDYRCPTVKASRNPTWVKENEVSANGEARAVGPEDRSKVQTAVFVATPLVGCLCGCGGDAMHCLRPNRPPSPNTRYEDFLAPNFTRILRGRLAEVLRSLEPSKRVWWRERFGGCAPDREPLLSETWTVKDHDRGNVLRTSPPPFDDIPGTIGTMPFQSSCNHQRSKNSLESLIHGMDEPANALPEADKYASDITSKNVPLGESGTKSIKYIVQHWTHADDLGKPRSRAPTFTREAKPLRSPTHYIPDYYSPLKMPDYSKESAPRRKIKKLTAEEDEQLLQSGLRKLEAVRLNMYRRYGILLEQDKPFSAENPYLTSKSHNSKNVPPNIEFIRKEPTAEEDEQLSQSDLRKLEAVRLGRLRLRRTPRKERTPLPLEYLFSNTRGDQVKGSYSKNQAMRKEPTTQDFPTPSQLLHHRINIMRVRRNRRHGTALHRHDDVAVETSDSNSQAEHVEEIPSNVQIKNKRFTIDEP